MDLLRQTSAVLAVFALLGLLLWFLRRGGLATLRARRPGPRSLESVERLLLTPSHSLHLVKIRGREIVVATYPQGCALLLEHTGEHPQ
jgi:flagellar biogenesis protein FliO